jgi:transposase
MPTAQDIKLKKENLELKTQLEISQKQIQGLQNQLSAVLKMLAGKKSEKRTDSSYDHPSLFDDISIIQPEEVLVEEVSYTRQKRKGKPVRKPLPDNLRREIVEIFPENIPEGSKCIGQEETEVLEIVAAEIYVKKYVRYKYALPNEEGIIIGKMPKLPIHKSNAGATILSHLLIGKYLDHLPWYRQLQQFKRYGVELSDSTVIREHAN